MSLSVKLDPYNMTTGQLFDNVAEIANWNLAHPANVKLVAWGNRRIFVQGPCLVSMMQKWYGMRSCCAGDLQENHLGEAVRRTARRFNEYIEQMRESLGNADECLQNLPFGEEFDEDKLWKSVKNLTDCVNYLNPSICELKEQGEGFAVAFRSVAESVKVAEIKLVDYEGTLKQVKKIQTILELLTYSADPVLYRALWKLGCGEKKLEIKERESIERLIKNYLRRRDLSNAEFFLALKRALKLFDSYNKEGEKQSSILFLCSGLTSFEKSEKLFEEVCPEQLDWLSDHLVPNYTEINFNKIAFFVGNPVQGLEEETAECRLHRLQTAIGNAGEDYVLMAPRNLFSLFTCGVREKGKTVMGIALALVVHYEPHGRYVVVKRHQHFIAECIETGWDSDEKRALLEPLGVLLNGMLKSKKRLIGLNPRYLTISSKGEISSLLMLKESKHFSVVDIEQQIETISAGDIKVHKTLMNSSGLIETKEIKIYQKAVADTMNNSNIDIANYARDHEVFDLEVIGRATRLIKEVKSLREALRKKLRREFPNTPLATVRNTISASIREIYFENQYAGVLPAPFETLAASHARKQLSAKEA